MSEHLNNKHTPTQTSIIALNCEISPCWQYLFKCVGEY